jgi:threonylcarbamoyladenosine tRNA methylthiotransferase MtaB
MLGVHITTLGCKLNQLDSADLAGALRGRAAQVADPSRARLIVVNTCTVTQAADADARQILRRRRRESPAALIVATGCYAEREPAALEALPEVDLVLRREERPHAARLILDRLRQRFPEDLSDGCADRVAEETLPDFGERSRAFLRVQDGCDLRCSYCIIPQVRGLSRSVPPREVAERFQRLIRAGFREVVLTGVNTGDYGEDLEPRGDLPGLVAGLASIEGDFRIRLNSVEPRRVTPALADLMESQPKLARHLQIPLQSGSDRVLSAMRRNYRTGHYRRVLETLRRRASDMALGADVIVGFPGETDREFEETLDFVASSPLNYLHVFSYSRRPGTPAAELPGQVPPAVIAERSRRLREAGRRLAISFKESQAERPLRALVLKGRRQDGRQRALTSNYIEVAMQEEREENTFQQVTITGLDAGGEAAGVYSCVQRAMSL